MLLRMLMFRSQHTDDEAGSRYASTRSSASSRYPVTPSSSRQAHARHASQPDAYAAAQSPTSPVKKPPFFNRLFGGMHLRERSLDAREIGRPSTAAPYYAPSMVQAAPGMVTAMYDARAGAGSQRGRKLMRRELERSPRPVSEGR